MALFAPRLRQDLQVSKSVDQDGVLFFDVRDPTTGGVLRLYDFEWFVAERLDGQKTYEELSHFAKAELGFAPSPKDLEAYVDRLADLGFFEGMGALAQVAPPSQSTRQGVGPGLAPMPEVPKPGLMPPATLEPRPKIEARPEPKIEARPEPQPEPKVEARPEPKIELQPEPKVEARPEPQPEPKIEVQPEPKVEARPEPQPEPKVEIQPEPKAEPLLTARPEDKQESLRDTLKEVTPPVETEPLPPVPQTAKESGIAVEMGETAGPPKAQEAQEAEPTKGPVLVGKPDGTTPSLDLPIETVLPAASTEPLPQVEPDGKGEKEPIKSQAPTLVQPKVTVVEEDEDEVPGTSSLGRWIAILVVLIALGVAIYFLFRLERGSAPVAVKRATPHEVVQTLSATLNIRRGETVVLKMEAGGMLASVVSEGAEVSAGMSLAVLQSQTRLQKDVADLRERLAYYQHRMEVAKDKGDEGAAREAQSKIKEKEERLNRTEAELKKTQLLSTRPGRVLKVMARVGDLITPQTELVEVADKAGGAELRVPEAEGREIKVGQDLSLLSDKGTSLATKVQGVETALGTLVLRVDLPEEGHFKSGDQVRVVKGRLANVEELPAAGLLPDDSVYVIEAGKAVRRKVTVVSRKGSEVLVAGLSAGDEVIVAKVAEIQEGQSVKPAP